MRKSHASYIAQVVDALNGPVATAAALGGAVKYQEVQRWVARGWASPHHVLALEPHLPEGVTLHDLLVEASAKRAKPGIKQPAVKQPRKPGPKRERGRVLVVAHA